MIKKKRIALCVPNLNGRELFFLKKCVKNEWVSTSGLYVNLFEKKLAKYVKSKYAIAVSSGTSSLHIALKLVGVEEGDEVIAPSLTFIAPINAISYNGAKPIFMDSDEYFNISSNKTIDFITNETYFKNGFTYNSRTKKKIKAILPVHVWGNAAYLDELILICRKRNIKIVEDASESLGTYYIKGKYKNKYAGTIGDVGCFSFNGNKIITTGGGGMIVTNDKKIASRAKYLTTQSKDDPVKFIHNAIGYNLRLTNIQAALGIAQLNQLHKFLKKKDKVRKYYFEKLKKKGLSLSPSPYYSRNNNWMNLVNLKINNFSKIMKIVASFEKFNIETRPVWQLNHLQKPYLQCQNYQVKNSLKLIKNFLCIPSSVNLNAKNLNYIIDKF